MVYFSSRGVWRNMVYFRQCKLKGNKHPSNDLSFLLVARQHRRDFPSLILLDRHQVSQHGPDWHPQGSLFSWNAWLQPTTKLNKERWGLPERMAGVLGKTSKSFWGKPPSEWVLSTLAVLPWRSLIEEQGEGHRPYLYPWRLFLALTA